MKSKITTYLRKQILLIIGLISGIVFSQTPVTYAPGPTNAQINAAIIGNNITITGGALNNGIRNSQIATFTGGNAAGLSMDNGAFFSTGLNTELLTINNSLHRDGNPSGTTLYTDADLATIDNTATRDVVSYSFNVTLGPKATTLNVKYQFGSEEYPDYVASAYDDAFGFFVTGPGISGTANLAKLPNGNNTSINKVNYGVPGFSSPAIPVPAYDGSQNALYTNNGHNTAQSGGKLVANTNPGPFPIAVQFNGITKLISYTLSGLTPGGTYTFKIIIGDAGDTQYDSGVFINTIYATANVVANNDTYTILSGSTIGGSVLNNDTVNGVSPASLSDVLLTQVSSSSPNVTLNPITGAINVAGGTAPGVYTVTYQICDQTYTANCKTATATITVQINDSDNDGIDNYYDLDDDNDGILDATENSCATTTKTEGTPIFINDFGTGATTTDPYVLSHAFVAIDPNDGQYAVTTSNNQTQYYTKTDLTGNKDAGNPTITNGTTTGRYLIINIDSPNNINKAIYRIPGINVQIGQSYRFRIDLAGLANGLADIPNLKIAIKDASNNELASANSSSLGMANDDVWRRINLDFTATTNNIVLEIINQQPTGGSGNDAGIDNIILTPLYCDLDNDGIPNQFDLDSDGDGCPDAIEGSENVKYNQIHNLNLPLADPNYAYRGQIKVTYNGTTTSTPSGIISTSAAANGVPQLVNNAGNNLNASTNPSNLAGV
ncbi:choice-of-anchor L domain-containing protein, partial [Cloacibacterium rupense]